MGFMGSVFLIPVFAQTFLGYSATETGYLFMPLAFAMVIAAQFGSRLVGKVESRYVIFASTLIAALGLYLFAGIDARSTAWDIIYPLTIMAFGLGFGMAQRTSAIASAVPEKEIGIASSVLALVRNIAGAFGIAVFATILNNSIESHVISLSQGTIINVHTPLVYSQVVPLLILKAQINAYSTVFLVSAAVVLVGAFIALLVKTKKEDDVEIKTPME